MPDEFNPAYYKQGDIEAIEAIEAMLTNSTNPRFVDYCRCQILHYLWRMGLKDDVRKDAGKARWYINRLIDYLETHAEHDERTDLDSPKPAAPSAPTDPGWQPCKSQPLSNEVRGNLEAACCDRGG